MMRSCASWWDRRVRRHYAQGDGGAHRTQILGGARARWIEPPGYVDAHRDDGQRRAGHVVAVKAALVHAFLDGGAHGGPECPAKLMNLGLVLFAECCQVILRDA